MQLADLDATAQAELVRSGQCSPRELLDATIEAIERVNPKLNAVVIPLFDYAHAQLERGEFGDGPFCGVPLVLKDLGAALAGTPQYGGTRVLRDHKWISPSDSELTARFRRAGFIFTGKTNTPEFGLSPTTEPETFGPTRNPWHTDRIVGGSSGGSASAVASRMVAIAHAGDGGGSIRNPAGACGVVGLKPSRGRITLGPDIGESWSGCVTEFVIARTVRDLAHVLDCVHGYMSGDPAPAPPPARPYGEELGREPGRYVWACSGATPRRRASPDARAAVEGCAKLLAGSATTCTTGTPPNSTRTISAACSAFRWRRRSPTSSTSSRAHRRTSPTRRCRTGHLVRSPSAGRALTATQYLANLDEMHRYARRLSAWWEHNDILITPTMSEAGTADR
jgi:amidase